MAWTQLSNAPGSPASGSQYLMQDAAIRNMANFDYVYAAPGDQTFSPGLDIGRDLRSTGPLGFPNKVNTGWINYSTGGGGSPRPSGGFLYPRG